MFEVRSRNQIRARGCLERLRWPSHRDRSVYGNTNTCLRATIGCRVTVTTVQTSLVWKNVVREPPHPHPISTTGTSKPSFVPDLSKLIPDARWTNHIRWMKLFPNVSDSPVSPPHLLAWFLTLTFGDRSDVDMLKIEYHVFPQHSCRPYGRSIDDFRDFDGGKESLQPSAEVCRHDSNRQHVSPICGGPPPFF